LSRLLRYLFRFATISFGFFCAALAAGLFASVLLIGASDVEDLAPFVFDGPIYAIVFVSGTFFAYQAFVPAFVAIMAAEFLRLRDWLYFALGGGAVAAGAVFFGWERVDFPAGPDMLPISIAIACGMVGGLVYWLVAGRQSGCWMDEGAGDRAPR
jgi:hypothetical protein